MREKLVKSAKVAAKRLWADIKAYRIALIAIMIYNVVVRIVFHAACPQLIITGIPCAGCGMTRAVWYIAMGQLARGMRLNPAAPLWMALVLWLSWNRYVRGVCSKKTKVCIGVVCVVSLAIYIYRMTNCFPGRPPMVYYRNNVIRKLLRGLSQN